MPPTRDTGFTLVELLVVMVVVAVLSAIAVPVFLAQRTAAVEASMKSDARQVAQVMESYYGDQGRYAGTIADLEAAIPPPTALSGDNEVELVPEFTSPDAFCVQVTNVRTTDVFYDSDAGGLLAPGVSCT